MRACVSSNLFTLSAQKCAIQNVLCFCSQYNQLIVSTNAFVIAPIDEQLAQRELLYYTLDGCTQETPKKSLQEHVSVLPEYEVEYIVVYKLCIVVYIIQYTMVIDKLLMESDKKMPVRKRPTVQ